MLNNKLVLIGNYHFSIHINQGVVFAIDDMTVTDEEADTMIIQQLTSVGAATVLIVADDTYVFGPVSRCVKR